MKKRIKEMFEKPKSGPILTQGSEMRVCYNQGDWEVVPGLIYFKRIKYNLYEICYLPTYENNFFFPYNWEGISVRFKDSSEIEMVFKLKRVSLLPEACIDNIIRRYALLEVIL